MKIAFNMRTEPYFPRWLNSFHTIIFAYNLKFMHDRLTGKIEVLSNDASEMWEPVSHYFSMQFGFQTYMNMWMPNEIQTKLKGWKENLIYYKHMLYILSVMMFHNTPTSAEQVLFVFYHTTSYIWVFPLWQEVLQQMSGKLWCPNWRSWSTLAITWMWSICLELAPSLEVSV